MFPVLLSFGFLEIRTLNFFLFLGLLIGLFVFWRKGKEEHYEEMMLFDGLILSLLFGVAVGRLVFILLNFSQFSLNPIEWLDVFSKPGFTLFAFFFGSGFFIYRYAQKKKWDVFEILDFWTLGMTSSLIFIWLGYFFEGVAFGVPTDLPWGMTFPSVFEKHHPVQLYFVIFFILLFFYLSWAEFRYRTFAWYRAGRNTAQTGYLISIFLIATGFVSLVMSLLTVSPFTWQGIRFDSLASLVIWLTGSLLLYFRSGRTLPFLRRKSTQTKLEEFKV